MLLIAVTHLWPFPHKVEGRFLVIKHAGLGCREVGVLPQLLASYRVFPQSLKVAHFDYGNEEITLTMAAITVAGGHMVKLKVYKCHYQQCHIKQRSWWITPPQADRVEEILVTHLCRSGGQQASSVTLHPTAIMLLSHLHHCTAAARLVFSPWGNRQHASSNISSHFPGLGPEATLRPGSTVRGTSALGRTPCVTDRQQQVYSVQCSVHLVYTPCNLWSIGKCSQHFNADFLWWGLNTFNFEIGRHGMRIKW